MDWYIFAQEISRFSGIIFLIIGWGIFMPIMIRKQRGPLLRDKYTVPFLEKHLKEWKPARFDHDILTHTDFNIGIDHWIQRHRTGIVSQWRIRGVGRIPRFSKAERILNAYHRSHRI